MSTTTTPSTRVADCEILVDLLIAYSNRSDVLFDLVRAVERVGAAGVGGPDVDHSVRSGRAPRAWRVADRLSEGDLRNLVSRRLDGATVRQLAEEFDIGLTSVKRLLRDQRARLKPAP